MSRTEFDEKARVHEEEYFRRREVETLERCREQERERARLRALADAAGVSDEVAVSLGSLGFEVQTLPALEMLPAVWTAWAEDVLTSRERSCLTALAAGGGVEPGTPASDLLLEWLEEKPSETFFVQGLAALAALLRAQPPAERSRRAAVILDRCGEVARASGGLVGFFGVGSRVCEEEHAVINRIRSLTAVAAEDPRASVSR